MPDPSLSREPFGHLPDGTPATVLTLQNDILRVRVTDYGGRMVSIEAPDRSGQSAHILLGFDDVHSYATAGGSFGALLGRCANRIAGGEFEIDGTTYHLVRNDQGNTLHGGAVGFGKATWKITEAVAEPVPQVVLTHVSADGDQGFPGELTARAIYRLEGDTLCLELHAETTRPTVVNLSAHPYFNLAGAGTTDILGHVVTMESDAILPTDRQQIPTGEIRPVQGTPFDFRRPTPVGARIRVADEQLLAGNGYDHCWVLRPAELPRLAARIHDPLSGRILELRTNQPGMQFYTGNTLNGSVVGQGNVIYRQSAGFALEAQGLPDAPHHANFPSTVLRPGEDYHRSIHYRFAAV